MAAIELPIEGEPADVVARSRPTTSGWPPAPTVPKLLLTFGDHPTLMINAATTDWCREHIAGLEVRECGPAAHVAPEDRPDEIAAAIVEWADRHRLLAP